MTNILALTNVTDILDNDLVMITHSNGESFKIAGSEINKRNQAVIASTTTMTGAPLKTGNIVRVYFTADITGSNTTTGLVINYNNVNYSVKVPKNGTLANFVASDLGGSPAVYKYLQANTMLELLYDGTQFIITGNPVVLSSSDYTIYADGKREALGVVKYLIPIRVTFATTNSTDYVYYKTIGNYFSAYFNSLPEISGKTKKVRLLINAYTQSANTIIIGLRKRNDVDYTVVLEQYVWGGSSEYNYSNLYWIEIDSSYLDSYTTIGFKTNDGSNQVGIGYCFAEVYYE